MAQGVEDNEVTCEPLILIDTAGCDLPELELPDEQSKGNEGVCLQLSPSTVFCSCCLQLSSAAVSGRYYLQLSSAIGCSCCLWLLSATAICSCYLK